MGVLCTFDLGQPGASHSGSGGGTSGAQCRRLQSVESPLLPRGGGSDKPLQLFPCELASVVWRTLILDLMQVGHKSHGWPRPILAVSVQNDFDLSSLKDTRSSLPADGTRVVLLSIPRASRSWISFPLLSISSSPPGELAPSTV